MVRPIISLTTDFGLRDPYAAEMKAAILSICPDAYIVDISHDVDKFDARMGAFMLTYATPFFPESTVHVAVVDPGVGTKRRPLLVQTKKAFFIGPDNGVLALAASNQGIKHIYEITNPRLMLLKVSSTFHGRDIFAPAAAHLANGKLPAEFGPEIRQMSTPKFAKLAKKRNMLIGEVIHIDDFGNIITNFGQRELESIGITGPINIKVGSIKLKLKLCKTYSMVTTQKPVAIVGSHDLLEISINQGNAAKILKTRIGDKAILHCP